MYEPAKVVKDSDQGARKGDSTLRGELTREKGREDRGELAQTYGSEAKSVRSALQRFAPVEDEGELENGGVRYHLLITRSTIKGQQGCPIFRSRSCFKGECTMVLGQAKKGVWGQT